jgi:hypothetical protein
MTATTTTRVSPGRRYSALGQSNQTDKPALGDEASAEEIVARFPVPCADIADRLIDLLFPHECSRRKSKDAA